MKPHVEAKHGASTAIHSQSYRDLILAYLEAGNPLTKHEARQTWGCDPLAARIDELRQKGHKVITDMA